MNTKDHPFNGRNCQKVIIHDGGGVTVKDTGKRHQWTRRAGYKVCEHCSALFTDGKVPAKYLTSKGFLK